MNKITLQELEEVLRQIQEKTLSDSEMLSVTSDPIMTVLLTYFNEKEPLEYIMLRVLEGVCNPVKECKDTTSLLHLRNHIMALWLYLYLKRLEETKRKAQEHEEYVMKLEKMIFEHW